MILDELQDWPGIVEIDGIVFDNIENARKNVCFNDNCQHTILLRNKRERNVEREISRPDSVQNDEYIVTVRQYMTRKSTAGFDFMKKWNNDIPMPLITMVGYKEQETNGMILMNLHGELVCENMDYCMRCGKAITNPVSKYFGMGPECGGHHYVNPFDTEEELKAAVYKYRTEYLHKIHWRGWIIKSAIVEMKELKSIIR